MDPMFRRAPHPRVLIYGSVLLVFCAAPFLVPVCDGGSSRLAREATARHLIDQIDQAIHSYETDHGAFPPGDGNGSKEIVEYLQRPGPKKLKYFEFFPELLRDGHVINPTWPDEKIVYYRCPGRIHPQGFDLWAEDSHGNPTGINNW